MKVSRSAHAAAPVRKTRAPAPAGAEALEPRTLLSVAPAADNAPPVSAGIPFVAVDEDAPDTVIDLFALFSDDADPDEALTFSVAGVSAPKLVSPYANPKTGTLTLDYVAGASGTADVTVRAVDTQGAETLDTFTVTIRAINDAPVNRVPGPQVTAPGGPLTFGGQTANLLGVNDVDLGGGSFVVTLRVDDGGAGGTVTLPFVEGLVFLQGDGEADAAMSFTATARQVNVLSRLRFDPAPNFTGVATLTLTSDDQGNTGAGGPLVDTDTVAIHVVAPPQLSVGDRRVVEGNDGTTSAEVTVTLSEPYPVPVRARWATANGTARVGADVVADGGFESVPIGGGWVWVPAGSAVGPWAVESGSVDIVAMWQDAQGNQSLDLSGASPGSVYQDLATVPGQSYTVRFALAGNPEARGADPVKRVTVDFGDAALDTVSFDVTGHSLADMGWEQHAYTVTATSAVTRLRFTSLTEGDTGPAIDDVRVTLSGDYEPGSGFVDFAPGETSKTVTVGVNGDTEVEDDETFVVDLSDVTNATIARGRGTVTILDDDGPPAAAPRVSGVFVSGPQWPQAVKQQMPRDRAGEFEAGGAAGFLIPAGAGDGGRMTQLAPLPWIGASQVLVRFDSDVVVARKDLSVRGVGGRAYEVTGFEYDAPTHTAAWTLATNFSDDRIVVDLDADDGVRAAGRGGAALDGEWDNDPHADPAQNYPSGDGAAGGDFGFRFNMLPGDVNGDGRVNAVDLAAIKRRLNRTADEGPGEPPAGAYSVFADVTADGTINSLDLGAVRQRLNRRLPADVVPAPSAPPSASLTAASPTADLFREDPILG